jgi:hypothetical protein
MQTQWIRILTILEKFLRLITRQTIILIIVNKGKDKGKAIPLQAWTGPEGSRRSRLPDFKKIGTRRW